jgi:hypothetical protein
VATLHRAGHAKHAKFRCRLRDLDARAQEAAPSTSFSHAQRSSSEPIRVVASILNHAIDDRVLAIVDGGSAAPPDRRATPLV